MDEVSDYVLGISPVLESTQLELCNYASVISFLQKVHNLMIRLIKKPNLQRSLTTSTEPIKPNAILSA